MNTTEYLNTVAHIAPSDIPDDEGEVYLSDFDNSYLTRVGMEDSVDFLAKRDITEQLSSPSHKVACIGFSPADQKWYGWSHRAIFGFGIGSEVKKGDCGFVADSPEELIDDYANFFADISQESADRHRAQCQILPDRSGIRILHAPLKIPVVDSWDDLPAALDDPSELPEVDIMGNGVQIIKCGRGEWKAETLEDAKQMAMDFAEGVG